MSKRGHAIGAMFILAVGAAACGGDDTSGGPGAGGSTSSGGGSGGTSGGGAATGGNAGASTSGGSSGSAGSSGGTANTDGSAGARVDGGSSDGAPPALCGPYADGGADAARFGSDAAPSPTMTFFVSSQKNMTGNLGGLVGADARCQSLATAVGSVGKVWHAYLSTSTVNARDRIGTGPWYNALGVMVAANLTALHARKGDPLVFVDEHGNMIDGQWTGTPIPNEHDILTGSNADGTLAVGKTCLDWTSDVGPGDAGTAPDGGDLHVARVGHTDGFGPMCAMTPNPAQMQDVTSWNSAHDNAGCNDTAPRGGAGRIYCFAVVSSDGGSDSGND